MRKSLFISLLLSVAALAPAAAQRDDTMVTRAAPKLEELVAPSPEMAIKPATSFHFAPDTVKSSSGVELTAERVGILFLLPFAFAGAVKSVSPDRDSSFVGQTTRQQHNNLVRDVYYFSLNGVLSTTIATLPACATATVTSKIKTTNATVLQNNGVARALGASDNFWTLIAGLTAANLATGFVRRYLLLVDNAGVATVQPSFDAATAAGCLFAGLPAAGQAIAGIATIANTSGADFIPAVTLLGAAGIATTYIDGVDDSIFQSAVVTP